ncbi:MAG: DUF2948 family protein [Hyphomonadaceae bacterium]|nr:DUF2948 family protein [Hyphomonadaceae bacterium]
MSGSAGLRLIAEDEGDLQVISAAVQDAVTQAGNLGFKSRQRRFTMELNRYRWEEGGEKQRVRALLAIDGVLSARVRGLPQNEPELVISVLQVQFTPGETPPGGTLTILLAGDGEIALEVEALDVTLLDSEQSWPTRSAPDHERRRR